MSPKQPRKERQKLEKQKERLKLKNKLQKETNEIERQKQRSQREEEEQHQKFLKEQEELKQLLLKKEADEKRRILLKEKRDTWRQNLASKQKTIVDKIDHVKLVKELYLTLVLDHGARTDNKKKNDFQPNASKTVQNDILVELVRGMPKIPSIGYTYDGRLVRTNPMRFRIESFDETYNEMTLTQMHLHTCCGKTGKPIGQMEHSPRLVKIVWIDRR